MSQPNDPRDDPSGDERDAWLSEALRHAPDADAAPPSALRDTILRQARAVAAAPTASAGSRRGASPWQRLGAAWRWLSGPRVAGALASVLLATVVGVMWWGRPIEEALQAPAENAVATNEAPAAAAASTAAPTPMVAPAPTTSTTSPSEPAQARAEPGAAAPQRRAPAAVKAAAPEARAKDDRAAAALADEQHRARNVAREAEQARAASHRAAEADDDARKSAPAAAAQLAAPAPASPPPPLPPPPAPQAAVRTDAPAAKGLADAARSTGQPGSVAAGLPEPLASAWGALLAALREEPEHWHVQRDGGAPQPASPRLTAWLARLEAAGAGRWGVVENAAAIATGPAAGEVRLLRDGELRAIVRLAPDATLRIDAAGQPAAATALAPASAAALRSELDAATHR